jgi:undecaprenyl-diphosphatase
MSPSLLQIVILAIVQGLAELLPVSSSAHVIIAAKLMRLEASSPELTFLLAMLHTGTMFAMIVYFWNSWKRSFFANPAQFRDAFLRIALATVATLAVGGPIILAIERFGLRMHPGAQIEELFGSLPLVAAALAMGGLFIVAAGLGSRPLPGPPAEGEPYAKTLPWGPAFWIGAAQGLCLPFRGLSRSGTTISTGMLLKVPRRASEEFSFALAVVITPPVILREVLRLYHHRAPGSPTIDWGALAGPGVLGMGCSFIAGLVALKWLSGWLENGRWHYFGIYCFVAAAGVWGLSQLGY